MTQPILWPTLGIQRGPISQIQPFTYGDDVTYLNILYLLRNYITDVVAPQLNNLSIEVDAAIADMLTSVDNALTKQSEEVDEKLQAQSAANAAVILELTNYVNEQVQLIIEDSIQVQDPVVAGLLNDPESATRVAGDGTYVGLPLVQTGRLSENGVNASIDERVAVINVANFPTVQDAIDSAVDGSTLYFPPSLGHIAVPFGGFQLKANNLTIDAMGVTFDVDTWGTPAFLALRANNGANGHTFRIGMVRYTGERGNHLGPTIRGSAPYCSGCGVWSNGDRNFIEYLRTDGMPTPVFFSSWDGTSASDRIGVGNRIGYLEATRYNFALLFVAQRGWDWGDAYCHDDLDDSGGANPTHAIYGSASALFRSPSGVMGRWTVENNLGGAPFQFKFTDGIKADILSANNCAGIASIQSCHDFAANALIGYGVRPAIPGSRIVEFVGGESCKRPNIGRILIDKAAAATGEAMILILDEAGYIGSITVTSRNTVDVGAEIALRGVGTFSIPSILVTALGTPARPVRIGNGTEAGKAAGWNLPNIRSVGGGTTYDPVPVEEYPQCYSNSWGDGNVYMAAAAPAKGIFRRNMSWGNAAPAGGAPKGWIQVANGGLSNGDWAAGIAVAAGEWRKLTNNAVIRYIVAGTTGAGQPAATVIGATGTDGTATYEVMTLTAGSVLSTGNL